MNNGTADWMRIELSHYNSWMNLWRAMTVGARMNSTNEFVTAERSNKEMSTDEDRNARKVGSEFGKSANTAVDNMTGFAIDSD